MLEQRCATCSGGGSASSSPIVGIALVFAMGLVMRGLSESFSLEVDRTLHALDAEVWAVSEDASGPFTSFVPLLASTGGPDASPVMVLRQTISDGETLPTSSRRRRAGSPWLAAGGPRVTTSEVQGKPGRRRLRCCRARRHLLHGRLRVPGGRHGLGSTPLRRSARGLLPLVTPKPSRSEASHWRPRSCTPPPPSSVPAGLKTMSIGEVKTDVLRPLQDAMSSIAFVRLLLWIVAATIIGSMLYLQAMERTRDFAVFKATGTSTVEIGMGLALQAVALSLTAALLAAGLAVVLAPLFPMPVEIPTSAFLLLPVVTVTVGLSREPRRPPDPPVHGQRYRNAGWSVHLSSLQLVSYTPQYSGGGRRPSLCCHDEPLRSI